jgi:Glycine-rich protein domain (DUF2403)
LSLTAKNTFFNRFDLFLALKEGPSTRSLRKSPKTPVIPVFTLKIAIRRLEPFIKVHCKSLASLGKLLTNNCGSAPTHFVPKKYPSTYQLTNQYNHSTKCKHTVNMEYAITAGAVLAAAISGVSAQACAAGSAKEIGGNWYCDAVKAITYSDFGSKGSYNRVTSMDGGNCQSQPVEYSGALAPLDGEVRSRPK